MVPVIPKIHFVIYISIFYNWKLYYISDILIFFRKMQRKGRIFKILNFHCFSFQLNFETFSLSTNCTKRAIKWTKIHLQTSVIPIWKAENQGYNIGYDKCLMGQLQGPKNKMCPDLFRHYCNNQEFKRGKVVKYFRGFKNVKTQLKGFGKC